MSPADNTPDFDNMSPEEMMAWMESLAKRQGVDDATLTTSADMQIAEIDPDSVQFEDNYVPSNWTGTKEEWQQHLAKERADKQAAAAAKSRPVVPEPVAPPEPVAAAPVAAAPSGPPSGEIDYENMSPEELMAFMETLAARQGATEGFTLGEDKRQMNIQEIDPDSVQFEDNYVPSNWTGTKEEWQQHLAEERATKQAAAKAKPVVDLPIIEDDEKEITEVAPPTEAEPDWITPLPADQLDEFPQMDLSGLGDELPDMAFPDLGDLGDEFPQMDLSDFGSDLEIPELEGLEDLGMPIDAQDTAQGDSMDWLDHIAGQQTAKEPDVPSLDFLSEEITPVSAGITDPDEADVDPLQWLESLAEQQGVSSEEFITDAGIDVPAMERQSPRTYNDYSVEEDFTSVDDLDEQTDDADDPVKWLEGLAQSVGEPHQDLPDARSIQAEFEEDDEEDEEPVLQSARPTTDEDILAKLGGAQDIDPQDMENWMAGLLDQGLQRPDIPALDEGEEKEIELEANIPDWLIEQVGPPPDMDMEAEAQAEVPQEAVISADMDIDFDAPPPESMDIPDWLQESAPAATAAELPDLGDLDTKEPEVDIPDWLLENAPETDIESIFDVPAPAPVIEDDMIDMSDSWAEAFEAERTTGEDVPGWYEAALSGQPMPEESKAPASQLPEAHFEEETKLSLGELEAVPGWIELVAQPEAAGEPVQAQAPVAKQPMPEPVIEETVVDEASASELPDWLKTQVEEEDVVVDSGELPDWLSDVPDVELEEVPDWLVETIEDGVSTVAAEPEPVVVQQPVAASKPVAPQPVPVAAADVVAALESARGKVTSNLDGALQDYESVVRANTALDDVVKDLTKLLDDAQYKQNPAIYRVLGDGLMRLGRLQEALNTYRKALNLL